MEIIQPWQLYLILQADDIRAMLRGLAGCGVVACEMCPGDGVLFTIKKCKQSPAQHQSSCHVRKNFH